MSSRDKGIKVVIDEHCSMTLLAIRTVIQSIYPDSQLYADGEGIHHAIKEVTDISADLLITDLSCSTVTYDSQVMQLYQLCQQQPQLRVVIYSHAVQNGGFSLLNQLTQVNFILRHAPLQEFKLAIATIVSGGRFSEQRLKNSEKADYDKTLEKLGSLTHCEKEVLAHLLCGKSLSDISDLFHRSIKTISAHKCSAMRKLETKNAAELFMIKHDFFRALNLHHFI